MVENTDIPVMSEENERFVDNDGVADFAFVDDETEGDKTETDKLAEAAPVATSQPEFAWVDNENSEEGQNLKQMRLRQRHLNLRQLTLH